MAAKINWHRYGTIITSLSPYVGECSFWYRPTRVVPDQRPLNGRRCCCCCHLMYIARFCSENKQYRYNSLRCYSAPDTGAKYCDECVCVCLSVRNHIFGTIRPIFTKFLCMLPMAVARSSFGGVYIVIRHVLPVLWMTSYLLISYGGSTSPPS